MKIKGQNFLVKKDTHEEKRSEGGIIIDHSMFKEYEFTRTLVEYATVSLVGENQTFVKEGDRVIIKKDSGHPIDHRHLVSPSSLLARVNKNGSLSAPPENILVKIRQRDRDALFSKFIKREDGTEVQLFVDLPPAPDEHRASALFVSSGLIVAKGDNVHQFQVGDEAILDYTVDNEDTLVVGYDGGDKIVSLKANTTFVNEDKVMYANRKENKGKRVSQRDQILQKKGDYDEMSVVLGVVRNDKLIANEPYVFLEYEEPKIKIVTKSGIEYTEDRKMLTKKVLAVSENTRQKYGIEPGKTYIVDDFDVFDVKLNNGKVSCINDLDIYAHVS